MVPGFALNEESDWALVTAHVIEDGDSNAVLEDPPPLWFAEYEDFSDASHVRLSGHAIGLADYLDSARARGLDLEVQEIGVWSGAVGAADEPGGPVVAVVDAGDHVFVALSYDLDVDEIQNWLSEIRPATIEEFLEAPTRGT